MKQGGNQPCNSELPFSGAAQTGGSSKWLRNPEVPWLPWQPLFPTWCPKSAPVPVLHLTASLCSCAFRVIIPGPELMRRAALPRVLHTQALNSREMLRETRVLAALLLVFTASGPGISTSDGERPCRVPVTRLPEQHVQHPAQ